VQAVLLLHMPQLNSTPGLGAALLHAATSTTKMAVPTPLPDPSNLARDADTAVNTQQHAPSLLPQAPQELLSCQWLHPRRRQQLLLWWLLLLLQQRAHQHGLAVLLTAPLVLLLLLLLLLVLCPLCCWAAGFAGLRQCSHLAGGCPG
jgi:hypothetical protein